MSSASSDIVCPTSNSYVYRVIVCDCCDDTDLTIWLFVVAPCGVHITLIPAGMGALSRPPVPHPPGVIGRSECSPWSRRVWGSGSPRGGLWFSCTATGQQHMWLGALRHAAMYRTSTCSGELYNMGVGACALTHEAVAFCRELAAQSAVIVLRRCGGVARYGGVAVCVCNQFI